jgi:hypothetical protein
VVTCEMEVLVDRLVEMVSVE